MKPAPVILCLACSAGLAAQNTWFVRAGSGGARIAGPAGTTAVRELAPAPFVTAAGGHAVHFGADAAGRPASLDLGEVRDALVQVAVDGAPPLSAVRFAAEALAVQDGGVAYAPGHSDRDVRIAASAQRRTTDGDFGLVVRSSSAGHYRFEWADATRRWRLVRRMGGADLVLGVAEGPAPGAAAVELALQVAGFRLEASVDDAVLLRAFDGAFTEGASGVWRSATADVAWSGLAVAAPAALRASAALVTAGGVAELHAVAPVVPGSWSVLELRLDRPHPLLPETAAGEPWILQPPAAPIVARGDWRGSLGPGAIGEVDAGGCVRATIALPDGLALRGQSVLVQAVLVDPAGETRIGRTPPVPLWLPMLPGR